MSFGYTFDTKVFQPKSYDTDSKEFQCQGDGCKEPRDKCGRCRKSDVEHCYKHTVAHKKIDGGGGPSKFCSSCLKTCPKCNNSNLNPLFDTIDNIPVCGACWRMWCENHCQECKQTVMYVTCQNNKHRVAFGEQCGRRNFLHCYDHKAFAIKGGVVVEHDKVVLHQKSLSLHPMTGELWCSDCVAKSQNWPAYSMLLKDDKNIKWRSCELCKYPRTELELNPISVGASKPIVVCNPCKDSNTEQEIVQLWNSSQCDNCYLKGRDLSHGYWTCARDNFPWGVVERLDLCQDCMTSKEQAYVQVPSDHQVGGRDVGCNCSVCKNDWYIYRSADEAMYDSDEDTPTSYNPRNPEFGGKAPDELTILRKLYGNPRFCETDKLNPLIKRFLKESPRVKAWTWNLAHFKIDPYSFKKHGHYFKIVLKSDTDDASLEFFKESLLYTVRHSCFTNYYLKYATMTLLDQQVLIQVA